LLYGGGIVALALLALWVYCIVDVISTDESLIRNLPKMVWLLIVIFLPTVGSIVWLLLGRPERAGFAPGDSSYRAEPRGGWADRKSRSTGVLAPDDDPRFLAEMDERARRLREWEDELKRREEELGRREKGDETE
jgi:hypothetical protein